MGAWGKALGGDLAYLADTHLELTRKLGLVLDATAKLGGERSMRYALLARDGVVTRVWVEEPGKLDKSTSASVLAAL